MGPPGDTFAVLTTEGNHGRLALSINSACGPGQSYGLRVRGKLVEVPDFGVRGSKLLQQSKVTSDIIQTEYAKYCHKEWRGRSRAVWHHAKKANRGDSAK